MINTCIPFDAWLAANKVCATDDVRYYLCGVRIIANRIEATNGHVAYLAKLVDYKAPDSHVGNVNKKGFIVSPKNKIPKSTLIRNIRHVLISSSPIKKDELIISYISFYGEVVATDIGKLIDGRFPNIPKLAADIRKKGKSNDSNVSFNGEYFLLPHELMKETKTKIKTVSVELFGENSAAIFYLNRGLTNEYKEQLIIMPMRQ